MISFMLFVFWLFREVGGAISSLYLLSSSHLILFYFILLGSRYFWLLYTILELELELELKLEEK
jgi:hypothetical protein